MYDSLTDEYVDAQICEALNGVGLRNVGSNFAHATHDLAKVYGTIAYFHTKLAKMVLFAVHKSF